MIHFFLSVCFSLHLSVISLLRKRRGSFFDSQELTLAMSWASRLACHRDHEKNHGWTTSKISQPALMSMKLQRNNTADGQRPLKTYLVLALPSKWLGFETFDIISQPIWRVELQPHIYLKGLKRRGILLSKWQWRCCKNHSHITASFDERNPPVKATSIFLCRVSSSPSFVLVMMAANTNVALVEVNDL